MSALDPRGFYFLPAPPSGDHWPGMAERKLHRKFCVNRSIWSKIAMDTHIQHGDHLNLLV
jgi:hypothetical protein